MYYSVLVLVHLFAAIMFVGTVFFEVLILEGIRKNIPRKSMSIIERAIGTRARRIMPWVILILYSAGITMALQYKQALSHPLDSTFGTLLLIKIILATSVFIHFVSAMTLHKLKKLRSIHFKLIHISVFCHVVAIVFLAKGMFFL